MNLSEQDKRDIAQYLYELQGAAPRAPVPDEFIRFKELRELPKVEISAAFKIPLESDKETVIARLDNIADFIAPRATAEVYGLVRISSALDSMSNDTALSSNGARTLQLNIDKCAKLAGAEFTGDIKAPNVIATAGVSAQKITATDATINNSLSTGGDMGCNGAMYCANDITAFNNTATNAQILPTSRKVIDHKPELFNTYTLIDVVELLADEIDKRGRK